MRTGGEHTAGRTPIIDGPFAESKEMLGGPGVDRRVWSEEV
jgi:hypothetical protein